ncbi:MAG TPA: enoyl-CoA hydratase/isomerase family protein [Polyangia bacterium]|nr:enoyl-CoA hydratase/isomerase family protein [Polyangia bacterium]
MSELSVIDGVAWVRLAAGKANAMSSQLLDTIGKRFAELDGSGAAAVVVTGYDRYFSAGLALPTLIGLDRPAMERFIEHWNATMARVLRCPLPVVAAVNGHAIAGGCVLALQADYRIMADSDAKIGLNEVQLGIGLPAIAAETLRLRVSPRAFGPIALAGQLLAPRRALELGLVDELAAPAELEERAAAQARGLASAPAGGFAQVKAALRRPVDDALARGEAAETERWLDTWFSEAAQARLHAAAQRLGKRG